VNLLYSLAASDHRLIPEKKNFTEKDFYAIKATGNCPYSNQLCCLIHSIDNMEMK
jgi:hypothetical protein